MSAARIDPPHSSQRGAVKSSVSRRSLAASARRSPEPRAPCEQALTRSSVEPSRFQANCATSTLHLQPASDRTALADEFEPNRLRHSAPMIVGPTLLTLPAFAA